VEAVKDKTAEIAQRIPEGITRSQVINRKTEALMIMTAMEAGDPKRRDKVESWLAEVKE
jgi:predicted RNA-binding protein associated with RNAse of E/G family